MPELRPLPVHDAMAMSSDDRRILLDYLSNMDLLTISAERLIPRGFWDKYLVRGVMPTPVAWIRDGAVSYLHYRMPGAMASMCGCEIRDKVYDGERLKRLSGLTSCRACGKIYYSMMRKGN